MAAGDLTETPLVAIVGPTASGKTGLAIEIAKRFGGEIVCADSRTIYKGMDIGTAKPTAAERAEVPHWGLDLVEPGDRFTAADFKEYAEQKILEIRQRGHIPMLVGGTGLYIDSVLFDYQFPGPADMKLRAKLEKMSVEELQEYCTKINVSLPRNATNRRHLVSAIERNGQTPQMRSEPISTSIIVGISTEKELLRQRIQDRAEQLFENGVVDEAISLGKKYGWDNEAMTGNIYRLVHEYIAGQVDDIQLIDKFTTSDWRLAKRQLTWLKRNRYIIWLPLDQARDYISGQLAEA